MSQPKGIRHPVKWEHDFWEDVSNRSRDAHPRVVQLIEEVAAINERSEYIDQEIESDLGILLVAKTDAGDAKFSRRYRRAVVLAHEVKLATRRLIRAEAARIIEQIDRESDNGGTRREIVIEWSMQTRSIADQIKALDRAVRSKSQYKIEAAWFGINPHAHEYLAAGYEIARRAGKFKNFSGELEVTAQLIPVRIPSPELLRLYLPDAVRAAACPSSGFLGQLRV